MRKQIALITTLLFCLCIACGQDKTAPKSPDVMLGTIKSKAVTSRREILKNTILKCTDPSYAVVSYKFGLQTKNKGDYIGDFDRKNSSLQNADIDLIKKNDSARIIITGIVLKHNGNEIKGDHIVIQYNN